MHDFIFFFGWININGPKTHKRNIKLDKKNTANLALARLVNQLLRGKRRKLVLEDYHFFLFRAKFRGIELAVTCPATK